MGGTVTVKDLVILFHKIEIMPGAHFCGWGRDGIFTAATDPDPFQSNRIPRRLVQLPYTPRLGGRIPLRETPT